MQKHQDFYMPVTIGGVTFKNPFYVASGPTTKTVKQLKRIEETGWGAASIKLTIDPAPYVNRKPRYAIFPDRNALCFTVEKRLTFAEGLQLVVDAKKVLTDLKLFANITYAGDKGTEGWVNMAKQFEEVGADVIELNMCCPNMSYNLELTSGCDTASSVRTGASLGQQGDAVAEIVRAIKKEVKIPVFVKLTPEGGQIAKVAAALYAAGADAVGGTANRMGIPPIDLENPTAAAYHLQKEISMSCHSGRWLKPLAQRDTYEIRKVNGAEPRIMAAGGIASAEDALQMVMCGADMLGICAETLISGFDIVRPIMADMQKWLDEHGHKSYLDIRDTIVNEVKTATEVTLYGGYAKISDNRLAAPCKSACPHHVPAQAYVRKVAEGDVKRAYEIITQKGPLQAVCGEVCSHPCEEACTKAVTGRPVMIREIKRYVLEEGRKNGWAPKLAPTGSPNGHKVAVVGGGPAGISCAATLAQAGYAVTLFEREAELGGMLRYCLPDFRLAKQIVADESAVLQGLGVNVQTGRALGKDFTLDSLKAEGYESVFLGIGASKGRALGVPGEDAAGVYNAVDLLRSVSEGQKPQLGKTVVVLGGGFTAVDTARTALRLGAEKVYIAYRRTKDEMPATAEEITEAEAEGIKLMYLVSPLSIKAEGGKVSGIEMCNQVLGEADDSARRRPEAVDAVFTLPCDSVIAAIGQVVEETPGVALNGGQIKVDAALLAAPGVYAGGDAVEVKTVIAAIAAGRQAAVSIDQALMGEKATIESDAIGGVVDAEDVLKRTGYLKDTAAPCLDTLDGTARSANFDAYKRVLSAAEALAEASRCLACGCGEGCAICVNICPEFTITQDGCDHVNVEKEECVACGMCYNRCPNQNIEMVSTGEVV